MLHAPLTLTTAKLDISLLLKSSPSPPASAAAEIYPFVTRSTSLPTTTSQSLPQLSSHGTSPSSGVSITNSHAASRTPSQSYSQPQRTVLPPLRAPSPFLSPRNSARGLPATSNYTQTGHPPAKRPPPTQNHPSASPAKKQSKWTAEEDALIIDLRGSGMKWEDISKRLPGRSAISCRLHYQNYLERRSEWDEEKKNRLARLYERYVAPRAPFSLAQVTRSKIPPSVYAFSSFSRCTNPFLRIDFVAPFLHHHFPQLHLRYYSFR